MYYGCGGFRSNGISVAANAPNIAVKMGKIIPITIFHIVFRLAFRLSSSKEVALNSSIITLMFSSTLSRSSSRACEFLFTSDSLFRLIISCSVFVSKGLTLV